MFHIWWELGHGCIFALHAYWWFMRRGCDSASEKGICKWTGYHLTVYLGGGEDVLICLFISYRTNIKEMPVTTSFIIVVWNSTYFSFDTCSLFSFSADYFSLGRYVQQLCLLSFECLVREADIVEVTQLQLLESGRSVVQELPREKELA